MDAQVSQASEIGAYGQAVWSCPLDAGVKLRKAICAATVANKPETPGRAWSSRSTIAQGMPECSAHLWWLRSYAFFNSHTRLRVRLAPGIPCALCFREGHDDAW